MGVNVKSKMNPVSLMHTLSTYDKVDTSRLRYIYEQRDKKI